MRSGYSKLTWPALCPRGFHLETVGVGDSLLTHLPFCHWISDLNQILFVASDGIPEFSLTVIFGQETTVVTIDWFWRDKCSENMIILIIKRYCIKCDTLVFFSHHCSPQFPKNNCCYWHISFWPRKPKFSYISQQKITNSLIAKRQGVWNQIVFGRKVSFEDLKQHTKFHICPGIFRPLQTTNSVTFFRNVIKQWSVMMHSMTQYAAECVTYDRPSKNIFNLSQ